MRGYSMKNKVKGLLGFALLSLSLLSLFSNLIFSSNRKLRVVVDGAYVHLDPDRKSMVVATLKKGELLTLGNERKFRKNWNYVYFISERTGRTKSGYILDSLVEKLFEVTKVLTIQGGDEKAEDPEESKTHFRNTRWGMTKEQVLRIEGQPVHLENSKGLDIIQYPQRILNMECLVGYVFAENRLAKAKYSFLGKQGDKNQYVLEYQNIKNILISKYGRPLSEKALWHDPLYKGDDSNWGLAISQGHLELNSRWKDNETEILLRLSGGNNRLSLVVEYSGLEYKELTQKAQERSSPHLW